MEKRLSRGRVLRLVVGDITRIPAGAIVNAANSRLAGGGGVDGAIHRAGGAAIMRELDAIRARQGGCPTGSAVATTAGDLPAKYVFHAVGPVYRGGTQGEGGLLASCYRACLALAEAHGVGVVSFPSISTGVYGYPIREAAPIALGEAEAHLGRPESRVVEAIFVLFAQSDYDVYAAVLEGRPAATVE
ncbi:MAG: macro domain-containing protein [Bryobacterales bacterium]|nr:macro domain-containing protein [Bryobacterales bacterium]